MLRASFGRRVQRAFARRANSTPDERIFGLEDKALMYYVNTEGQGALTVVGQLDKTVVGHISTSVIYPPGKTLIDAAKNKKAWVIVSAEPQAIADFTLTDQDGRPSASASCAYGMPWCSLPSGTARTFVPGAKFATKSLTDAIKEPGEEPLLVVLISIDGERDTPDVLRLRSIQWPRRHGNLPCRRRNDAGQSLSRWPSDLRRWPSRRPSWRSRPPIN